MRIVIGFVAGVAAGAILTYLVIGPVDWDGVRQNAGTRAEETGRRARDMSVTAAVRAALALQKEFDLFGDVEVRTRDGVVTLRGRVATEDRRRLAELITRGVEGVDEVVNELEVGGDDLSSDALSSDARPATRPAPVRTTNRSAGTGAARS